MTKASRVWDPQWCAQRWRSRPSRPAKAARMPRRPGSARPAEGDGDRPAAVPGRAAGARQEPGLDPEHRERWRRPSTRRASSTSLHDPGILLAEISQDAVEATPSDDLLVGWQAHADTSGARSSRATSTSTSSRCMAERTSSQHARRVPRFVLRARQGRGPRRAAPAHAARRGHGIVRRPDFAGIDLDELLTGRHKGRVSRSSRS